MLAAHFIYLSQGVTEICTKLGPGSSLEVCTRLVCAFQIIRFAVFATIITTMIIWWLLAVFTLIIVASIFDTIVCLLAKDPGMADRQFALVNIFLRKKCSLGGSPFS